MKKWLVGLTCVGMWAAAARADLSSPAALPVAWAGETGFTTAAIDALTGWDATGLTTPYATSTKFDGAGDNVIVYFDGEPSGIAYTVRRSDAVAPTNQFEAKLQESADNSTWTDVRVFDGSELDGTLAAFSNALSSSSRYVKFLYSVKAGGQNFGLGSVNIASSGPPPPATTNVKFTASAASVNENAGTYEITVIKTLAEGDVGGEIVLSGTATPGDDYTVDATNFTLNGATTAATFTVTIVDDEDEEPAETVVLTLANVAGGTAVSPSAFTLTLNASDMGEPTLWLNEINYDPVGTDEAGTEWLEVAGPSGMDLSAFVVVLYNGSGGAPYNTTALSGTIDDEGCGYGAVDLVYAAANSLQNGAPDGVALAQVNGGVTSLVQFLSYEGTFTGVGGPADGVGSVDIGTHLGTEDTLQLGGTATDYSGFAWETNAASRGSLNANQSIAGCTPVPLTNVLFTASAASVDEDAGTYEITVIKNRAEGNVSGEIVLSGTATSGDDYAINATNFTLNGAVTSATFTVTIVDDDEQEPAETVVLSIANVVNGTIAAPSVFTLTIGISDVPAEGIVDFRFTAEPYLQATAKDDNLAVSDMALTAGSIETAIVTGDYFTDEPYIEESAGWTATSQAEAKAFQFTITPAEGASISIDGISFNAYATAAGPSAFGYDIGGGMATYEVDAPSATLLVVSQSVAGIVGQTGPIVVKIQGWLNGSRESAGSGAFRLDDVVVHGSVSTGPLEFGVSFNKANGFTVEQGSSDAVLATAANGIAPYGYVWSSTLDGAHYAADTNVFTIGTTAPIGVYTTQVVATDSDTPAKSVTNRLSFSVVAPPTKYAITIVTNAPANGTVTTTPATEAAAGVSVTVNATPAEGYAVESIVVNGGAVAVIGNAFTMPAEAAAVTVTFMVYVAPDVLIDFEDYTSITYAMHDYTTAGVTFSMTNILAGGTAGSDRFNDLKSARFHHYRTTGNAAIMSQTVPFAQAITKLNFWFADYGTDSGGSFKVQVSDDGAVWQDVGAAAYDPAGTVLEQGVIDSIPANMTYVQFIGVGESAKRFNIDDIGLYFGEPVFGVSLNKANGFTVNEGSSDSITATAANGTPEYGYSWETTMPSGYSSAGATFSILASAPPGNWSATVTATDASDPVQQAEKTVTFTVVGLNPEDPAVVFTGPQTGTVGVEMVLAVTVTNATANEPPENNWSVSFKDSGDTEVDWTMDNFPPTFAFTPAAADTYTLSVQVNTDQGTLSNSVQLAVSGSGAQPNITGFQVPAGATASATLATTTVGKTYALQYATDLLAVPVVWLDADSEEGTGGQIILQDDDPADTARYYRVTEN